MIPPLTGGKADICALVAPALGGQKSFRRHRSLPCPDGAAIFHCGPLSRSRVYLGYVGGPRGIAKPLKVDMGKKSGRESREGRGTGSVRWL